MIMMSLKYFFQKGFINESCNFQLKTRYETHQLHIVYFYWCNMARLYIVNC